MKKRKINIMPWIFNTPYIAYSLVFLFIPLIWAIWLSMTDWNLMSPNYNFVNIQNFLELFSDSKVKAAFWNSFPYLVPIVILCFVFGLGIALLVSKLPSKLKGIAAVMFFIPYLTSGVSTSVMIKYLFSYNSAVSIFLREKFGLNINWLQSEWAFYIIIFMNVWKMTGYYALFILSGIESVSEELYEAAKLDGASRIQQMRYITLPGLAPTISMLLILKMGDLLKVGREKILLLYQPTTYEVADVISTYVYRRGLEDANYSYSTAVGLFESVVNISMLLITNKICKKLGQSGLM